MLQRASSSLLLVALLLTGCASSTRTSVEPPPVVRPVVVPERGADELLKAIALIKGGNLPQAEANFEEIVKVRPDLAEAHFNLGWVKQQLKKHPEAVVHLQNGLQLRPGEARAYALIGASQRELGEFAAAERSYLAGLTVAPEYDRLHFNLGILYDLYLFEPQKALEHYRRYQSLQKTPDTRVAGWIAVIERLEAKK